LQLRLQTIKFRRRHRSLGHERPDAIDSGLRFVHQRPLQHYRRRLQMV